MGGQRVKPKIIDKMPGQKNQCVGNGLTIMYMNTSEFKDAVHNHLSPPEDTFSQLTFHSETDIDFIQHILNEEKVWDEKNGDWKWVAKGANHYLDTLVYNFGLADRECYGGWQVVQDYTPPPTSPSSEKPKNDWFAGAEQFKI